MNPASRLAGAGRPALLLALGVLALALHPAVARPLRVAYTHSFVCVPLGIAEMQGFWQEAGLQVELRGYQTSVEVVSALRSAEVDLAFDQIATWVDEAEAGTPLVILGETDWSLGGDKLLLRDGADLRNLRGRPIAVCLRGSGQMLFLREALNRANLSLSEFPLAEVPEQEKALQLFAEGKLHAVVCNDPWASRLERSGAHTLATTADIPGIAPEGFAARRGQVDDATLQRFFAVWFRAVAFLHDPANAGVVAETASVYSFAGSETITAADVERYARTMPVHDAATSLRQNDLESGNVRQLIQRLRVLLRLQGRQVTESDLAAHFHLEPVRATARSTADAGTIAAGAGTSRSSPLVTDR
ncbi:ABC transporter substrate-binding protein [Opitutus terrae]|uniref:ABC transporter substrate-binding protein n=1 Tax=Opitutus terrae TaxID=107709 RepID=UPI0002F63B7E|nr:ABC transporter substrate-binding protein [Opitutus terrae]